MAKKLYDLNAYTAFKRLSPLVVLQIIKTVKAQANKEIKGIAALDQACFKYFVNNMYIK